MGSGITQDTIICEHIFEYEVVRVDTGSRKELVADSDVRQCPENIVVSMIAIGKKDVCLTALADFGA